MRLWSSNDAPLSRRDTPDPAPPGPVDAVREIWQEVLCIDDIGADEDLFDLGGHSLTITQIMARIEDRLGIAVPMEVFYDTPTIADVAAAIARVRP